MIEEGSGGIGRVHDLGGGSPPLGGALLEEADGVKVAVGEVQQTGLLKGSGQRHSDRVVW